MLTVTAYGYLFWTYDSSADSLFIDSQYLGDLFVYLRLICLATCVCTCISCISQFSIYTVGDGDSFPIFNLLCNHPNVTCEIPRTLLVLSSSLVKATALRLLGFVLCLLTYR